MRAMLQNSGAGSGTFLNVASPAVAVIDTCISAGVPATITGNGTLFLKGNSTWAASDPLSTFTGTVREYQRAAVFTFATLPSTPAEGLEIDISNSNSTVWGATVTGSGSGHCLVRYNGSAWTVVGK